MDLSHARQAGAGWFGRAGARLGKWWLVKMLGLMAGMSAFFVVYFWLLRHPQHPVTTMPLTVVDRMIGFQPAAFFLYASLWVYVCLAPGLMIDRREIVIYSLSALALSGIGLGIFYLWPTTIPPLEVDWSRHPTFAFLKSVDASGNACPSLHVAFAVFSAAWIARLVRQMGAGRPVQALNGLWCLGIVYSTIAIRQHVALDTLAGIVLGGLVSAIASWGLRAFPGPYRVRPKF